MSTQTDAARASETVGLAIFASGDYQWLSEETDPAAALKEFDQAVGVFGEASPSYEEKVGDFDFYEIPRHQWDEWDQADGGDHPDPSDIEYHLARHLNPGGHDVYRIVNRNGSPLTHHPHDYDTREEAMWAAGLDERVVREWSSQ